MFLSGQSHPGSFMKSSRETTGCLWGYPLPWVSSQVFTLIHSMIKSSSHLSSLHVLPKPFPESALLYFFLQISFLQAPDKVYLIALYLCHAYVSVGNSGLIGVTSLAGSWLSRVLSMENMHFASVFLYFPTKIYSSLL